MKTDENVVVAEPTRTGISGSSSHDRESDKRGESTSRRTKRRMSRAARIGLFSAVLLIVVALGAWVVISQVCPGSSGNSDTPQVPVEPEQTELTGEHPLDPAIKYARKGLQRVRNDVDDYTATILKKERIGGKLVEETMFCKIRNRKKDGDKIVVPFSIYLKFLAPKHKKGREVIWVEGRNDGRLLAHDVGWKNIVSVSLDTSSEMAMEDCRYPIYKIGMENLVVELLIKGERDRKHDECETKFLKNIMVEGRSCKLIEVTHPVSRPHFDFHIARIYIDEEFGLPIRYAAYTWPEKKGDPPVLQEEYTYKNLKVNVGLTEQDFQRDNPDYEFPGRLLKL